MAKKVLITVHLDICPMSLMKQYKIFCKPLPYRKIITNVFGVNPKFSIHVHYTAVNLGIGQSIFWNMAELRCLKTHIFHFFR